MIYGERIRFRAPERKDIPTFTSWFNDPEVRHGLTVYLPMSLASEEKWFENMLSRPQEEQPLVIETKNGDEWVTIGNLGLASIDKIARATEFGIVIGNKEYWNQGYGTEALQLLLKHCFETLNLNRVMLRVYQDNPRAIRVYEKVGFKHEGAWRQARFHNGKYYDILFMGILKEEWEALNQ